MGSTGCRSLLPGPAGPVPARGSAAATGKGDTLRDKGETPVLHFKVNLPAWHFHYFHLGFFLYVSVAARGLSFPSCFQTKSSFSSLPYITLGVFLKYFSLSSFVLFLPETEVFP